MTDTNGFFTKARTLNKEVLYYTSCTHTAYCYYLYITIYINKNINSLQKLGTMHKQITKSRIEYFCVYDTTAIITPLMLALHYYSNNPTNALYSYSFTYHQHYMTHTQKMLLIYMQDCNKKKTR